MNFYLSKAIMQANNTLPEAIAHNIETRLNISSFYQKLCTLIPRHKLRKSFSKFFLGQFRHRSFEVFINKPEILNYFSSLEDSPLGSKQGNAHTPLPPLFSILAGIGLTFVWQDQRKRNRWSSTISRLYLLSPHCNAVIPLVEVLQKINCLNNTISLLVWFATEYHSESCPTRSAITAFLSEHLSQPIEEGATVFPKSIDDSLGLLSLISLIYFFNLLFCGMRNCFTVT